MAFHVCSLWIFRVVWYMCFRIPIHSTAISILNLCLTLLVYGQAHRGSFVFSFLITLFCSGPSAFFHHRAEKLILYTCISITKTCLCNIDPIKPRFYIVKLGFTWFTLFFSFLPKNIDCGYSLEPPRRGGSNKYHNLCFEQKYEKISEFFRLKIFSFRRWYFLLIWIGIFS